MAVYDAGPEEFVVWWLAACNVPPIPTGDTADDPNQGVVLGIRTTDGRPFYQTRAYLGGGDAADPDAAGFVYYVNVPPGRTQVFVRLDGYATAQGAPDVQPKALSFTSLVMQPLDAVLLDDPTQPAMVNADGVTIELVGDGFLYADAPFVDPVSIGVARVDDRLAIPGDLQGLRSDDTLGPIVLEHVFAARAWNAEDRDVALDAEHRATVTVDLPTGSPALGAASGTRLWMWSSSRTYWVDAGAPVIDVGAKTATFSAGSFGWWALGRDAPERGCIEGRMIDAGAGLEGAEVRWFEDGTVGVDRVSTEGGAFCLPVDVGGAGTLRMAGVQAERTTLYTATADVTGPTTPGTCGTGTCLDLGVLPITRWLDADGDRSWSGPGGDCDDSDPGVNPNPTLGDGSWCGGAL